MLFKSVGLLGLVALFCQGHPTTPQSSTLPRPYRCGDANSPRVIAGREVGIGEVPWTALIQYRKPDGDQTFDCAGSLITERYVLTAANCVSGIPDGWTVDGVRLGEYDLSSEQDCELEAYWDTFCAEPHQDVSIEKIIVHENYTVGRSDEGSDIALLRLDRDVVFSEFIQPVCLPIEEKDRFRDNIGERALEVAWVRTENGLLRNKRMREVLTIMHPDACDESFKSIGKIMQKNHMCANNTRDYLVCPAIAGSSLMQIVGRTHFLYGINIIRSTGCEAKEVPDVFINVAKFVDWIASKLE